MYAVQHWARQLGTHEPVGETVPKMLSLWKWCHRGHNEQVSPGTTSSARLCLVAKKESVVCSALYAFPGSPSSSDAS